MASGENTAIHTRTLPYQVNQCRIEPAVTCRLLALPLTKTSIGLWDLADSSSEPLSLSGHKRSVLALRFSHDEPLLLCSASDDHIIVWNIRTCQQQHARKEQTRGEVIVSSPGDVSHVCFSLDAELLAVCVDRVVKLVSVSQRTVTAELVGHGAKVTGAEFCPHYNSTLVTISDDRTFKVWDVNDLSLVYQSTIIAPTPLISMSMNVAEPHVAIGTAGGVVKIFDLTDGNRFRQLSQLDVGKVISKSRQSRDSSPQRNLTRRRPVVVVKASGQVTRQDAQDVADHESDQTNIEASNSVLCLFYSYGDGATPGVTSALHTHTAVKEVLNTASPILAVVASHCLLQVDSQTLQPVSLINLHNPLLSTCNLQEKEKTLSAIGYAAVGQLSRSQLACVVGTLFEVGIHTILWQVASSLHGNVQARLKDLNVSSVNDEIAPHSESSGELSMVPTTPLTDHSPLRSELVPHTSSAGQGHSAKPSHRNSVGGGRRKSDPMHQPLTFKSKVKSSGYTQAPRTTMFQPKLNSRPKPGTGRGRGSSGSSQSLSCKLSSQEYPVDAGPPTDIEEKISTGAIPSAVTDLSFSATGHHLACSLVNMSALVFPAPFGHKDSSVYVGHDHAVSSVSWSNSNKYLITASTDKTAILWDRASAEVLLRFSHINGNIKSDGHGDKVNTTYTKEVKKAQFFYMDRFVLLIVGSHLCLYKCHIDPTKDDIRRYLTKSRYKLVQQWETQSQNFTALSAINTFHSHLAVCAGSNRDLEIFDLNEGRQAHTFTDVHAKPVHTIALNEGSTFTSQPEQAFNVFATSSTLDCVKLWDVRTKRHVLRLEGHTNNAHGCSIAFSPCGTYLGSGSEDKVAYVYDVRSGTYCQKLRGHTDVVSSVAFHPARPLLATGATDGKVVLFKAK